MLKTIVRTVYILAAAAVVFAGLYAYAIVSGSSESIDQSISGELLVPGQGQGQGMGSGAQRDKIRTVPGSTGEFAVNEENVEPGRGGEHISGDPGVLILIRNIVWVTGTIVIVLLLQAGWKRWWRRKVKGTAGSA